mmetsp:Transcript_53767/g.151469  ORF Transcript_53767/g.151469 Transcript_53767/m.151469 type:complete len:300 (+) Transcript_53767:1027-1926(+)
MRHCDQVEQEAAARRGRPEGRVDDDADGAHVGVVGGEAHVDRGRRPLRGLRLRRRLRAAAASAERLPLPPPYLLQLPLGGAPGVHQPDLRAVHKHLPAHGRVPGPHVVVQALRHRADGQDPRLADVDEPGLHAPVEVQELGGAAAVDDVGGDLPLLGDRGADLPQRRVAEAAGPEERAFLQGHGRAAEAVAVPFLADLQVVAVEREEPRRLGHPARPELLPGPVVADHPLLDLPCDIPRRPERNVDDEEAAVRGAGGRLICSLAKAAQLLNVENVLILLRTLPDRSARFAVEVDVLKLM